MKTMSLRLFSVMAPELADIVQITHKGNVLGTFTPWLDPDKRVKHTEQVVAYEDDQERPRIIPQEYLATHRTFTPVPKPGRKK